MRLMGGAVLEQALSALADALHQRGVRNLIVHMPHIFNVPALVAHWLAGRDLRQW